MPPKRLRMNVQAKLLCAITVSGFTVLAAPSTQAQTTQECGAKYQAAKRAGALNGQKWKDFRKAECGTDAAAAPAETSKSGAPLKDTIITPSTGTLVFPSAVDPKYAKEGAERGRMLTCADQYKANKDSNANGGMKWIGKGGSGYYGECIKRLKG
jgi:hypothetical protein